MPRLPAEVVANVSKAREAAMLAVEIYNRPATAFRSAGYIVLMVVAWTALFHAIFVKRKIRPFYRKRNSRKYEKVDGDYKTWELMECVHQFYKDQNPAQRKNLEFFVGLRNKIEHRFLPELDIEIFGECQALLLNFEAMLAGEFGDKQALVSGLPYALQFSKTMIPAQQKAIRGAARQHLQTVRKFVSDFRSSLSSDVQADESFSFKVFLIPKVGSQAKSSDLAIEFVRYDPSKPDEMKQYEKIVALIKPKNVSIANLGGHKAGDVVAQVATRIGRKFTHYMHQRCWTRYNIRPKSKSPTPELCDNRYCYYDVVHKDYVYTSAWIEFLVEKLSDEATYGELTVRVAPAA
ncbi:MAG: DUF3644 domain-containing protein [Terriglobia bacterium]|jgi:hypothetical protein